MGTVLPPRPHRDQGADLVLLWTCSVLRFVQGGAGMRDVGAE